MSSTFAFIPRTLTKASTKLTTHVPHSQLSRTQEKGPFKVKCSPETRPAKTRYTNEDYATLVQLALSDYALWSDPDLRRMIEWSNDSGPSMSAQGMEGFIPLSHLLSHSKLLAPLKLGDSQMAISKALRACAVDVVEVRLLVSDPSMSTWYGGTEPKDVGAYEIRRKDWAHAANLPARDFSRGDWEQRTIYVESIPVQYRTIPSIAQYVRALLSDDASSDTQQTRIQYITFPPHHQDNPGDQPICKGFALVVLANLNDVDYLLRRWPWDRGARPEHNRANSAEDDAAKFGFRALPKARWDQLKDEYLVYRGRLVEEINAAESLVPESSVPSQQIPPRVNTIDATDAITSLSRGTEEPGVTVPGVPTINWSSPYPAGSLVFVRNIHPETNKTTLRKLFATALAPAIVRGEVEGDGLDYVDFNKGMDSYHLRLATSKHAQIVVNHFTLHPLSQTQGLDDVGTPADGLTLSPIVMELVTGTRERVYWEKVPEKVRRQAVQKAMTLMKGNAADERIENEWEESGKTRKKKRRKH